MVSKEVDLTLEENAYCGVGPDSIVVQSLKDLYTMFHVIPSFSADEEYDVVQQPNTTERLRSR